jgi:hypothetical protein
VVPGEIDIYGVRFADDLLVRINNYTIAPADTEVISAEHIHINQIPAPNDFGLVFATGSCTTDTGLPGIRNEPTPVDVTVRNLPLGCENTLVQGLVYVPKDQTCVAAPVLNVQLDPNFNAGTTAGTCSPAHPLTLRNDGAGALEIQSVILVGRFFFDAGANNQNAGPFTVPAYTANTSLDVYFCPDVPNGLTYNGTLVVSSNDAGSPRQIDLSGLEATPPNIATNPYGNGDTWTFPATASGMCSAAEILTISNTGISDLTLQNVSSSDNTQFHIINPPAANTVLAPSGTYDVQVEFCPTAAGAQTGTFTINHDASNQPSPIQINLAGTGT